MRNRTECREILSVRNLDQKQKAVEAPTDELETEQITTIYHRSEPYWTFLKNSVLWSIFRLLTACSQAHVGTKYLLLFFLALLTDQGEGATCSGVRTYVGYVSFSTTVSKSE